MSLCTTFWMHISKTKYFDPSLDLLPFMPSKSKLKILNLRAEWRQLFSGNRVHDIDLHPFIFVLFFLSVLYVYNINEIN